MGFLSLQFVRRRDAVHLALWFAAGWAAAAGALHAQTDGAQRWPGPFSAGRNATIESSPAVGADGTIYVGAAIRATPPSGLVLAIDRNGVPRWPQPVVMPDWVDSTPALSADGTTLYVGCWDGNLYALATSNGAQRWFYRAGASNYIVSSPAIATDGTIYIGVGDLRLEGGEDSGLYAIHADGTFFWRKTTANPVESSPAIGADGTIYFGSFDRHVYAVAPDGSEKWSFLADEEIWGSPAIGPDGTVYIGTNSGRLYALSTDGSAKWDYPTGSPIFGGPAIGADGTIYIGSANATLHALNPDKSVRWVVNAGGAIVSTPAVRADGSILVGAYDSRIHAFHPENGAQKWSFATSYFIQSSPVIAGATAADAAIYFASYDGRIYALHSTASPLSSQSAWPMIRGDPTHQGRVRAPLNAGRLVNLATRAALSPDSNLITGFVVRGATSKYYLVRAVGPTLQQFGVPNPLPNPTVTLRRQQTGALVPGGFNDDWTDDVEPRPSVEAVRLGAFALPVGSKDAVVVSILEPSPYTATVGSADGGGGVALVEAYDARDDEPGAQLVNLSTRGNVAAGNSIIAGLVIRGGGPLRLLVRAVGPGLAQFGVANVLARPTLAVFSGQTIIRSNSGWTADGLKGDIAGAAQLAGAFPLADGSADSAALLTLNPGEYTIQVAGAANLTGEVLVEVYVAP